MGLLYLYHLLQQFRRVPVGSVMSSCRHKLSIVDNPKICFECLRVKLKERLLCLTGWHGLSVCNLLPTLT